MIISRDLGDEHNPQQWRYCYDEQGWLRTDGAFVSLDTWRHHNQSGWVEPTHQELEELAKKEIK